jgi:hypothetical protein
MRAWLEGVLCAAFLSVAGFAVTLPAEAESSEDPPPAWLFQMHPDAIRYADLACESFQMFAAKPSDISFSWIGRMDPRVCKDLLHLRDPAVVEQVNRRWREEFDKCVDRESDELSRVARLAACRAQADKQGAHERGASFTQLFFVPAWACAIAAQRQDRDFKSGVCVMLKRPEQDAEAWENLFGTAYSGINLARYGNYISCDDAAGDAPLSPFAAAALPLMPRGMPLTEIEERLSAMGFSCGAEPAAGKVAGVPKDARRCEVGLFGHRWQAAPQEAKRFRVLSFGDDLRITLHPGPDGRNLRSCAEVQSTGP